MNILFCLFTIYVILHSSLHILAAFKKSMHPVISIVLNTNFDKCKRLFLNTEYDQRRNQVSLKLPSLRSSHPEVFLGKGVLKICSKFLVEYPCQSAISIKLLCNFIGIALRHECSPESLLHIFRTPFPRNTYGRLLLESFCIFFPYALVFY